MAPDENLDISRKNPTRPGEVLSDPSRYVHGDSSYLIIRLRPVAELTRLARHVSPYFQIIATISGLDELLGF